MLRSRIRTLSILAALLALFVMTACVPADTGAADSGDMAADEMAEEGYPEEMIIGMGALPVTLVGNTVPIPAVPHLLQTALRDPRRA